MESKMSGESGYKDSEENQWTGAKSGLSVENDLPAEGISSERMSTSPLDLEEAMTTPGGKKPAKSRKMPGDHGGVPAVSRPGWEGVVRIKTDLADKMPGDDSPMKTLLAGGMPGEEMLATTKSAKPTAKK